MAASKGFACEIVEMLTIFPLLVVKQLRSIDNRENRDSAIVVKNSRSLSTGTISSWLLADIFRIHEGWGDEKADHRGRCGK